MFKTIIEAFAIMASRLIGYEPRPQQVTLAERILSAFQTNKGLMAKAPTGVGKSMAYLVPAIMEIRDQAVQLDEKGRPIRKRFIVTTANKALQDQLITIDLPRLRDMTGVEFTYYSLKGRSNYICLNKMDMVEIAGVDEVRAQIDALLDEDPMFVGDIDQLNMSIAPALKSAIVSDEEFCADCDSGCFFKDARGRARKADILVVNHSLWVSDLIAQMKTNGKVKIIGEYKDVIIDEAHKLEEFATNTIGERFTLRGMTNLTKRAKKFANLLPDTAKARIINLSTDIETEAEAFFTSLPKLFLGKKPGTNFDKNGRIKTEEEMNTTNLAKLFSLWGQLLDVVNKASTAGVPHAHIAEADEQLEKLQKRVDMMWVRLEELITEPYRTDAAFVRYATVEFGATALYCKPVSVAAFLESQFFSKPDTTTVMVSATLPFNYIGKRLGFRGADTLTVDSPFDYKSQGLLYIPQDITAPPKGNNPKRAEIERQRSGEVAARIKELVLASKGGALLLFTSNSSLNSVYNAIASELSSQFTILKQGERSNLALAQEFRNDKDAVLFATKSFFEGVDFSGDTCRLVVLDKIPFPIQGDPMVEARCDLITARTGDKWAFMDEYMVPEMAIALDQAMGRLIRRTDDRGVAAILDTRLVDSYDSVLDTLPPFKVVGKLTSVQKFFA